MKAKLIKTEVNYILEDDKGVVIASTSLNKEGLSLSIKNCQAIERGYDLDELAREEILYNDQKREWWKAGFQKALSILGDKKFNEEDMKSFARNYYREIRENTSNLLWTQLADKCIEEHIQSLQQTEWDVEIEMNEEKEFIFDPAMGISQGHYLDKPKLDATGCLILKRI